MSPISSVASRILPRFNGIALTTMETRPGKEGARATEEKAGGSGQEGKSGGRRRRGAGDS
ncbi:hypothetical protein SLEP1_g20509 [Rubroshorea leprosula]|uniref:Uncharacterized protein n=1 Tax=Rubroshorea leprosula TaxID=152421 RepID=A0AAV5JDK8_9ROSI|nr:hypothetical protein SLEP1_g20509 [Rubroshorea leprosula]